MGSWRPNSTAKRHTDRPPLHHLHRTLRQRTQEGVAVVLGENAWVEDDLNDVQSVAANAGERYFPAIAS